MVELDNLILILHHHEHLTVGIQQFKEVEIVVLHQEAHHLNKLLLKELKLHNHKEQQLLVYLPTVLQVNLEHLEQHKLVQLIILIGRQFQRSRGQIMAK